MCDHNKNDKLIICKKCCSHPEHRKCINGISRTGCIRCRDCGYKCDLQCSWANDNDHSFSTSFPFSRSRSRACSRSYSSDDLNKPTHFRSRSYDRN